MNKKSLLLKTLLIAISGISAQNSFFEATNYIGALESDMSKDWTKTGWTNFDPNAQVYPAVTNSSTLAAGNGVINITNTVTLDPAQTYLLSGIVAVKSGGELIIPAGTVIRAKSEYDASASSPITNYSLIVVEQGGKIFVNGTASNPVVMTSNSGVGSRVRGDWAGLVLCGNAVTNQTGTPQLEGFSKLTNYLSGAGGTFGGTNDADNSGVLKYLRVEFAGLPLDVNKEINGITFGGVGSATEVDYVQVSYSNDDSFEWFGGTVNCKHLIAYHGTDDDFDTDFGYRGNCQFGIGVKNPRYFDLTYNASSGASTSEGFESDNDATGSTATPFTAAIFSNFTMVGPISQDSTYGNTLSSTTKNAFRRGARLRRNTKQSIIKTIFMGYRNFLMIDGSACLTNYGVSSSPQVFNSTEAMFKDNLFHHSITSAASTGTSTISGFEVANVNVAGSNPPTVDVTATTGNRDKLNNWVMDQNNSNVKDRANWAPSSLLVDPQNLTNPDFRPVNSTVAVGVNDVTYEVAASGIYPNPVKINETLTISTTEADFSLVNTLGVEVKRGKDSKINMNGLEKGIYILQVDKKTTKVVVE